MLHKGMYRTSPFHREPTKNRLSSFFEGGNGELANFFERDSGVDNNRIRELVVGNRARNVAGIRESGELLDILLFGIAVFCYFVPFP